MASAREVRSRIRQQEAERVRARESGTLAVAAAWEKRTKALERLTQADRAVGHAVIEAQLIVAIPDLAQLAGVPVAELRRVVRTARRASDEDTPAGPTVDEGSEQEQSTQTVAPSAMADHQSLTSASSLS